ncbi:hypothetical protein KGA66_19935 [Actinocrinis puniceicyclus]|uniref:SRPBCC family protein n=1 Tax=Actinocrinis puniceicyclus TaxID=977794 RepID=A0A8J8BEM9_9ACTN|nr:hypothetical protein [Actinocrinis puniceicyclus]MBS2965331.1 hypothetical protein [Actinocrinis puniceicyclus]
MNRERTRRTAGRLARSAATYAVAYPLMLRKRCLAWGATRAEQVREMPGDELMPSAALVSTRAVTIDAPAAAIWPWLAQMGPGRGGAYTYDWIENLLGLDMHSADTVLEQYQHPQVGDAQRLGEKGPVLRVALVEPERALVLRSDDGAWVWAFGLYPDGGGTRLVSRNRISQPHSNAVTKLLSVYVMEPGSLIMERKMLRGVKARAERLARAGLPEPVASR